MYKVVKTEEQYWIKKSDHEDVRISKIMPYVLKSWNIFLKFTIHDPLTVDEIYAVHSTIVPWNAKTSDSFYITLFHSLKLPYKFQPRGLHNQKNL